MVKQSSIKFILLSLALLSGAEASAGIVQRILDKRKIVIIQVARSEKDLKVGDQVKLTAIHEDAKGYIKSRKGSRIRVRVASIGILQAGSRVEVIKTNTDMTAMQKHHQSRRLRDEKSFGGSVKGGFLFNDHLGFGAEGFLNLSPEWQLGLFAGRTQFDRTKEITDIIADRELDKFYAKKFEVTSSIILMQARYFFSPSFYGLVGAGNRTLKAYALVGDATEESVHFAGVESRVLQVGLGHLWIFDSSLFLGVEWASLVQPISSKEYRSVEASGEISEDALELGYLAEDDIFDAGKTYNYQAGLIQIGMLF